MSTFPAIWKCSASLPANRLTWDIDVDDSLQGAPVPRLILQPIVENAILHGLDEMLKDAVVIISADVRDKQLVLTVSDNGKGADQAMLGALLSSEEEIENPKNACSYQYPERAQAYSHPLRNGLRHDNGKRTGQRYDCAESIYPMTRKKILIADDNQLTLQSMQNTIPWNEWGFELIGFAENGNGAWQKIQELHPDIVILDIHMPGLNGLESRACSETEASSADYPALCL